MPYFLQEVHFLEHFLFREVIFHVALLYRLYSHLLTGQLVNSERNLAKGTLTDHLHELIVVKSRWGQLVVLLDVLFDKLDLLLSFRHDSFINFCYTFLQLIQDTVRWRSLSTFTGAFLDSLLLVIDLNGHGSL